MNVTTKQTLVIGKKTGKKTIYEEDQYEFCDDLWRYIKEFLLHEPTWFNLLTRFRDQFLYYKTTRYYLVPSRFGVSKRLKNAIEHEVSSRIFDNNGGDAITEGILTTFKLPRFKVEALELIKKSKKEANDKALFMCSEYKLAYDDGALYEEFPVARAEAIKFINFIDEFKEVENKLLKIKNKK